jgi:dipeptidyl aminopeptidase/acylaminoacyl peptidase
MKRFLFGVIFSCILIFFSFSLVARAQYQESELIEELTNYSYVNHPLRINVMQQMNFPGSEIVIEEVLPKGENYYRYKVSYYSENNKIYGVITVPNSTKPKSGYPAILLAHGYIPEHEYDNEHMYSDFVDMLSQHGYIVFIPDLRGHGDSEGIAEGAYFSPGYTIDFLNAFSSLSRFESIDKESIGAWAHSMGAHIVLRSALVEKKIKSIVIWSGVVGDYEDILYHWKVKNTWSSTNSEGVRPSDLIQQFGIPVENPQFWKEISPLTYIKDMSQPIQIHHGRDDKIVPFEFSQRFVYQLDTYDKDYQFYTYPSEDHDFSGSDRPLLLERTLQFFNTSLQ